MCCGIKVYLKPRCYFVILYVSVHYILGDKLKLKIIK